MSINKATSMEDVIARLEYISKRLMKFESPEDFALSMSIDECIDYLRENTKSPWHTGTPTEQGWYVCKLRGDDIVETHNFTGNNWFEELFEMWQKIELTKDKASEEK